ncbi:hypothetical protein B0H19DRAFT_1291204 [Mycena capillaripes]|nr:hypothetical protein B0H19DRAFT_1291204 [Mycena capillaripes]
MAETFFLNLGNDRLNITPSVIEMKSSKDCGALDQTLPDPSTVKTIADLPKSIVFTNEITFGNGIAGTVYVNRSAIALPSTTNRSCNNCGSTVYANRFLCWRFLKSQKSRTLAAKPINGEYCRGQFTPNN